MIGSELQSIIMNENFEYGIDTRADILIRSLMQFDPSGTRNLLIGIFLRNWDVDNIPLLLGILRIIARCEVFTEGVTIAKTALSHRDVEVQECGVRVFESWGTIECLKELENIKVGTMWLQEYIDEVVLDLRKDIVMTKTYEDECSRVKIEE
jgi:hypothetical protein